MEITHSIIGVNVKMFINQFLDVARTRGKIEWVDKSELEKFTAPSLDLP